MMAGGAGGPPGGPPGGPGGFNSDWDQPPPAMMTAVMQQQQQQQHSMGPPWQGGRRSLDGQLAAAHMARYSAPPPGITRVTCYLFACQVNQFPFALHASAERVDGTAHW